MQRFNGETKRGKTYIKLSQVCGLSKAVKAINNIQVFELTRGIIPYLIKEGWFSYCINNPNTCKNLPYKVLYIKKYVLDYDL